MWGLNCSPTAAMGLTPSASSTPLSCLQIRSTPLRKWRNSSDSAPSTDDSASRARLRLSNTGSSLAATSATTRLYVSLLSRSTRLRKLSKSAWRRARQPLSSAFSASTRFSSDRVAINSAVSGPPVSSWASSKRTSESRSASDESSWPSLSGSILSMSPGLRSADSLSSSASVNLIGMRCEPLSLLSVIRKDRYSTCSLFAQSLLYQSCHVVYHSHYSCIFNSHRTNDAEGADIVVRPDSIRCGDQSAVAH